MKLTELELHGTSRAENLYFAWSLCSDYDFGVPKVENGLFGYFQKSTDLEIEEKNVIKGNGNMKFTDVGLKKEYFTRSLYSKYGFGVLKA